MLFKKLYNKIKDLEHQVHNINVKYNDIKFKLWVLENPPIFSKGDIVNINIGTMEERTNLIIIDNKIIDYYLEKTRVYELYDEIRICTISVEERKIKKSIQKEKKIAFKR